MLFLVLMCLCGLLPLLAVACVRREEVPDQKGLVASGESVLRVVLGLSPRRPRATSENSRFLNRFQQARWEILRRVNAITLPTGTSHDRVSANATPPLRPPQTPPCQLDPPQSAHARAPVAAFALA